MIQFKTFTNKDAESVMNEWIASKGTIPPKVGKDYEQIRDELEMLYPDTKDKYGIDVEMGKNLYEYLKGKEWFNMRLAANDSFWKTMTVQIAPTIVAKRWGYDNIDHYYKLSRRIWFKAIWWYIHLSLVPSRRVDKTQDLLMSKNFTTDTIEQLVERPGSDGFNVKLCRKIVDYYSRATYDGQETKLFRSVMKLNTARTMVMEPELCIDGIDGYVKSLFTDLGATINM